MIDDELGRAGDPGDGGPEAYEAPAIEVLGSVEKLTRGPNLGSGDVPIGVISF